jgi:tyrosyl-tRNA synthetase
MVHSREELESAMEASEVLFGKGTTATLRKMNESTFLSVFDGVPVFDIRRNIIEAGVTFTSLCSEHSSVFPSKSELRRAVEGGGVSLNKEKVNDPAMAVTPGMFLNGRYLLVQKGKKNYFLLRLA